MSGAAPFAPSGGSGAGNGDSRPGSSSYNNGGERVFQHLRDLQRQAKDGYNPQGSAHQLLEEAQRSFNQSDYLLQMRRPDLAFVEYVRASDIVVNIIPRAKGWPDLQMDHGGGELQKYNLLKTRVNTSFEQFENIKGIIVNNNKRSGVQPKGGADGGHVRTGSAPEGLRNGANVGGTGAHRKGPPPAPKPNSMHGRAVSTSVPPSNGPNTVTKLTDRFARLGNPKVDTTRPESRSSNPSSVHSSPISKMPDPSDFNGNRASLDGRSNGPTQSKPQGPRSMPAGQKGPPLPSKLPLETSLAASMPREPRPTYTPARNMQANGNIELPRHTPRSLASSSTRKNSGPSSSAASVAPNGAYEGGDYFPAMAPPRTDGVATPPPPASRRKSVLKPKETRISNEKLYDYLELYNILLIDFRSRQEFDQGHIYARNVICVEPLHVTQGMSADELVERMVISPEHEQELFMNRDKFDLVVYYDAQTQSETFLTRPIGEFQTKLKFLHEALYEFNHEKPLQRPPIVLIGGIDAWTDLLGNQALLASDTANKGKQSRPIQRRPVNVGPLRSSKRRLREYNPMDDEEEKQWREKARAESTFFPTSASLINENGESIEDLDENDEDQHRVIDEFNKRFPDANSIETYAFAGVRPDRAPPEPPKVPNLPPKVPYPTYPQAPSPSNYESAPARPKPAAPRPSYTGVSDRAGSQNVPAARSSSLAPYIPPKYLAANLRLPKTGLINMGNTCYMNATLQALSATTPLSIFFLDDTFRRMLQKENWNGTKGVLSELYSNVIRSLWKGDVDAIRPSSFRTFCGRLQSDWAQRQEQDAKEFFDFLIAHLSEDLNVNWKRTPLRPLTQQEEKKREQMPAVVVSKTEWGRHTHRDQSFFTSLFGGQHRSRLTFAECGHTSTTYEAFTTVSVELEKVYKGQIVHLSTLDQCFTSYCEVEHMDATQAVHCTFCDKTRTATKQITFTRAPQFLVMHFKRFRSTGERINSRLDFPLEGFDLEPYMVKPPTQAEADNVARTYGAQALENDASTTPPYKYDAYAVVRHHGDRISTGHYTAVVKDRAKGVWRSFSDDKYTELSRGAEKDLKDKSAYIVFYQRSLGPQQLSSNGGARF